MSQIYDSLKSGNEDKLAESIRQMIRDTISEQANGIVYEGVSHQAGAYYSAMKSGKYGIVGASLAVAATYIGASAMPFVIGGTIAGATFMTGGTTLLLFGAGVIGYLIGSDVGNTVATNQLNFSKKARSSAMDEEINFIFSTLMKIAKDRDKLIAKLIKAKAEDEADLIKRHGQKLSNLTKAMIEFSEKLESEIKYAGEDTMMSSSERNEITSIVEAGKKGLISDVLKNRSALSQLQKKVKENDQRMAWQ